MKADIQTLGAETAGTLELPDAAASAGNAEAAPAEGAPANQEGA